MTDGLRESIETGDSFFRNRRIVKWCIAFDKLSDQLGGFRRKLSPSHFPSQRGISAQSLLRFYDCTYRCFYLRGFLFDERICCCHAGESKMTYVVGIVAAPDIDEDFPYPTAHCGLGAHGIGPKAIHLALLQSTGGKDAERNIAILCSRKLDNLKIAIGIDSGANQKLLQGEIGSVGGG